MKLIDVDALPKAMEYDYETGEMKILYYDAYVIAHAPTIDAIPIDFIDEWIIEMQGICDDDIEKNISNKFIAVALQALKFKWRKENESNISD